MNDLAGGAGSLSGGSPRRDGKPFTKSRAAFCCAGPDAAYDPEERLPEEFKPCRNKSQGQHPMVVRLTRHRRHSACRL